MRLLGAFLIGLLLTGSLAAATRQAQTIGCGNAIFGSLSLITPAYAQTIIVPCPTGGGGGGCTGTIDLSKGCTLGVLP